MTKADNFLHEVKLLSRDGKGFSITPWGFINTWRNHAVSVVYPYGEDSRDPEEKWFFRDGSWVLVENPSQLAHPLKVSTFGSQGNLTQS